MTNEIVSDDRGFFAWRVNTPAKGDKNATNEILYAEEIVAMLLAYYKKLAEI